MIQPKLGTNDYEINLVKTIKEYKSKFPHSSNEISVEVTKKASGRFKRTRDQRVHMLVMIFKLRNGLTLKMLKLRSQRSLATLSRSSLKKALDTVPLNIWLGTFFGPLVNPILDCRKRVEPSLKIPDVNRMQKNTIILTFGQIYPSRLDI